jgi:hypothetical protein
MTDNVLWRNDQWAVTEYGIERKTLGHYAIEKNRLSEDIEFGGWPAHIAEKDGDAASFNAAWLEALRVHTGHYPAVDWEKAAELCRKANRIAKRERDADAEFKRRLAQHRGKTELGDMYAVSLDEIVRLR